MLVKLDSMNTNLDKLERLEKKLRKILEKLEMENCKVEMK